MEDLYRGVAAAINNQAFQGFVNQRQRWTGDAEVSEAASSSPWVPVESVCAIQIETSTEKGNKGPAQYVAFIIF
jgi:hypothetical protein